MHTISFPTAPGPLMSDDRSVWRRRRVLFMQRVLGVESDGVWGRDTEQALRGFQRTSRLRTDGVLGPRTWDRLQYIVGTSRDWADDRDLLFGRADRERVLLPGVGDLVARGLTYGHVNLRSDAATLFGYVVACVASAGGVVTASGGVRDLGAEVTPSRVPRSMHYGGIALDLGVYTGMRRPLLDPFIVVRDSDSDEDLRFWRVFARVEEGGERTRLRAVTRRQGEVEVEARVLDFTRLMEDVGFEPVRARPRSWADPGGDYGGTEWWHFQLRGGLRHALVDGESTFGDMLLSLWTYERAYGSAPWRYRHDTYGEGW